MQRHLFLLFGLLALSLLGISGFQGYWLYGNYRLSLAEFARTTHETLEVVVKHQQLNRANRVFNIALGISSGHADSALPSGHNLRKARAQATPGHRTTAVYIARATDHTAVASQLQDLRMTGPARILAVGPPAGVSSVTRADSVARQLSDLVVGDWMVSRRTDLGQLSRAYQAELYQHQVSLSFRLDTLPTRAVPVRVLTQAGFTLHTPAVQLNPARGPYVVASFRPPTAYVLGYMAGGLAGSAVLLALTTTGFVLMMRTILRQKKLAEVKNDFINNMTHELKTPLATVSAAVEALQDFGALNDPRKTDSYLTIARQELTRLSDLVEKVLHIAVEERQGHLLALHPEPVDLAELVTVEISRHELCATKPVHFEVAIAPLQTLLADHLHLAGVLNNLFDNAVKYSGERVSIRVSSQQVAGGWLLTIADDGLGIAAEYQQAVFDQFFRVPTGNLHPVKGFGLGLYYVRQVITSHGGRISLRSEVGQGSEFIIWLPDSKYN